MSNIDIEAGGTYRFARVQNKTIILDSDNHSHAEKRFANQLKVSGSNVPNVALDVYVKTGGFARIYRQNGVGTIIKSNPGIVECNLMLLARIQ